jgi:hypothetical protein
VCATRCRLVVAQYHGSSRVGSFTSSRVNFLLLSVPVGPIMPLPGDNVHFPPWDTLTSSPAPHVALVGVTRRTYYVLVMAVGQPRFNAKKHRLCVKRWRLGRPCRPRACRISATNRHCWRSSEPVLKCNIKANPLPGRCRGAVQHPLASPALVMPHVLLATAVSLPVVVREKAGGNGASWLLALGSWLLALGTWHMAHTHGHISRRSCGGPGRRAPVEATGAGR